jgi:glycosyltransferase involved in cell wall biosynthesis
MIVNFFEPPPEKKIGGLELAVRSMEKFLNSAGVSVRSNPSPHELGKSLGPEVVHFHGLWEPAFIKISARCRRERIPYLVSTHGMLEPWALKNKRWKKWAWFQLFERRHLAGASRLLATGDGEAHNLGAIFPQSECVSLPLGLTAEIAPGYSDARQSLGWSPSETVLLHLSRIDPKKGLDILLHALAELDDPAKKSARLIIVGDGEESYLQDLKDFTNRERGRLPLVEWIGGVWGDAKWRYFQGADLFCLPSHSENFGLAILEALQVGTRVLTTNQTPWSDIASWGAGFICEPNEKSVIKNLEDFFTNLRWSDEQRRQLAGQIQARYSWDTVGPDYVRLYEQVCGTREILLSSPQGKVSCAPGSQH